jgi:hypothetical protein
MCGAFPVETDWLATVHVLAAVIGVLKLASCARQTCKMGRLRAALVVLEPKTGVA